MILETERLIIREYTPDDFDALYEILSDEETMKYYPKPYDENGVGNHEILSQAIRRKWREQMDKMVH